MTLKLIRTCYACPEQYDVFDGVKQVGYLRLRHGHFTVRCPDAGGDVTVYEATPLGDGIFDDSERDYYLRWAVHSIQRWMAAGKKVGMPPAPEVEFEVVGNERDA